MAQRIFHLQKVQGQRGALCGAMESDEEYMNFPGDQPVWVCSRCGELERILEEERKQFERMPD